MADEIQAIELEITPQAPDTVASAKKDLPLLIRDSLRQAGHEQLLDDGQISLDTEKTFPVDQAILIGLGFLSKVAYDIFKAVVLPRLEARFGVRQRPKEK